jgi:ABC-type transport system substrate-binding protein
VNTRLTSHRGLCALAALCTLLICALSAPAAGASRAPSATAGPVYGGTLHVAYTGNMVSFDPAWAFLEDDWFLITGGLYNGLYRFDRNGQPQLDLAAAPPVVSADRKTWTFTLRKGVLFSNGLEVTADDVKFSIMRVLSPHLKPSVSPAQATDEIYQGSQAYVAGKARDVSGIQVLGPYTIRFVLDQPLAVFPDILADSFNFVVPKAVVTKEGDLYFASHPIGTGAFTLQSWQKGSNTAVLVRNPRYFRHGKPYLDKVVASINVPSSVIALKIEKGELDGYGFSAEVGAADIQQASSDPKYASYVRSVPATWVSWINLNMHQAPLNLPMVRQAIALSINRERLVKLQGGLAVPANQFYIPLDPQYDPALDLHPVYPYDPQRARALVKASGYHGQVITILYNNGSSSDSALALALQQSLQQVGLTVAIRGMTGTSITALTGSLSGHQISTSGWSIDFPDAYDVYAGNFDCGVNGVGGRGGHSCDPTADSLVNRAQSLPFGAERNALLRQAQQRILRTAAYIPLTYLKGVEMVSPGVGGFYYQPIYGWVFEDYWLKH